LTASLHAEMNPGGLSSRVREHDTGCQLIGGTVRGGTPPVLAFI